MQDYIRTEAIFFEQDEAYQMAAYIDENGAVMSPNGSTFPVGLIVWRGEQIFKMTGDGEVEITEADLPANVRIRGEVIDKYRK